ncbi:MAG: hypothetical protein E4H27_06555 [Anaerolineales bacterium]|nr:MAG: hypothetical protein E4H27_06555 [Anaerolineales bacterium]
MGNRNKLIIGIIIIIIAVLGIVTCCVCVSAALLTMQIPNPTLPLPPDVQLPPPLTGESGEIENPPSTPLPLPDEAAETLDALESAIIPVSDLHELGIRYRGVSPDTSRIASLVSPDYDVGTVRAFSVSNLDSDTTFDVQARLLYKTDHVYMWVEEGLSTDMDKIQKAADLFEEHTYPTDRAFFGAEWSPGVDGDPHLSILHASNLGSTVAGYFSSADSYVKAVREDSNEMEMFYIHIDKSMEIGDDFYNGVLAHEFQHMIHWYNDRNETTWMNEGCSELAMELNESMYQGELGTYDVGGSEYAYLDNPDTQLTTWPEVDLTGAASAHYGASYLFMSYFLDRFGEEATKSLVAHPENGMESVNIILDELGLPLTHEDIVADWYIANLLDSPELVDGRYGYKEIDIAEPDIDKSYTRPSNFPVDATSTVKQYGVDYIEIRGSQPVKFAFSGTSQVGLMDTDAHSGKYLWWSNREDESDSRLSRRLDLTSATHASLEFWSWYHIEEDWDYAYVVVGTTASGIIPTDLNSTDISWTILDNTTLGCTESDPNYGNLGCGITGQSNEWEKLSANLDAFTGQEVVLRFEYITDAAVNQAGMAIDDLTIVVDGNTVVEDDAETNQEDWIAEGFVRHANVLPQEWIIQLVTFGDETQVSRLLFLDGSSGEWTIPLGGQVRSAVLAISAVAPFTTEEAVYRYNLNQEP